jgi:hypothetical protein
MHLAWVNESLEEQCLKESNANVCRGVVDEAASVRQNSTGLARAGASRRNEVTWSKDWKLNIWSGL